MNPWEDDDTDPGQSQQRNPLRDVVRDLETKLGERDTRLAQLERRLREQDVRSALSTVGADPRIATLIPSSIDPTEDAIGAWWNEHKDLFGKPADTPEPPAVQTTAEPQGATSVTADMQAQWGRIQSAHSAAGATSPDQETQVLQALQAARDAAGGSSDLLKEFLQGTRTIPT